MTTLKVTAKGQMTLSKDLLQHLGVQPGDEIVIEKLPQGRIQIRSVNEQKGDIARLFGLLKNENGPHLTIEEMNEVIARGGRESGESRALQISRITGIISGRRLVFFWIYRFRSTLTFSLTTP